MMAMNKDAISTFKSHMRNLISKNLMIAGLGLAAWSLSVISSRAADAAMKSLHGHVPAAVAHMTSIGNLSGNTNLQLAIGLPLRNQQDLNSLLQRMYDPNSPDYHHYLSSDEFTTQFGPSEQDYQAVKEFARTNGFEIVGTHSNRMLLDVKAKASDVERAFHVTLRKYHHQKENRDFFAPDQEPSVRADLPITDISGLSDYARPQPGIHKMAAAAKNAVGSGPGSTYLGKDFRNAYAPGATLNGNGQIVGLFQLDGYFPSDIANYESLAGLTNVPLQNILLDGATGAAGANNDEVCLDIEMSIAMAPGLSKVVVFEAPNEVAFWNDILNSMALNTQIKQFSSSWGYTDGGIPNVTTHQIFQQMALQGQTFFQASGDGNAWTNPIWEPADDPFITCVGGSELVMNGNGASYASESVWNVGLVTDQLGNPSPWFANGNGYWGSGGGISGSYSIPSYQTNVNLTLPKGSTSFRNVPDVAMAADNIFVAYNGGQGGGFMGTSCAAPLWAGFMALVNQQGALQGHASAGFINPTIYSMLNSAGYSSDFHDVVTGNDFWPGSPTLFAATTGYDLCTGLGTPGGLNLINAFLGFSNTVTHLSAPPKPYGSTLSVMNGNNPNGNWNLFIMSDTPPDTGAITNGWILTLVTANPVGLEADNGVTMSVSTTNTLNGTTFSYAITVTNYGPSISSNAVVTDSLSPLVALVSSNATLGTVAFNSLGVVWNVGTLAPGTGATLILTVQAVSAGLAVNTVTASSDTPDANPGDDSVTVSTIINPVLPLQASPGGFNGSHQFQITINGGPGTTNVVQVSTNLSNPNGWTPIYTNIGATPFTFTDPKSTNSAVRFYRDISY